MKGYSAIEIFQPFEMVLLERATRMMDLLPDDVVGEELRCHEVATAVGLCLHLPVQHGRYNSLVEHSWCWTAATGIGGPLLVPGKKPPNILDVYSVGRLPMVQLIDYNSHSLRRRETYYPDPFVYDFVKKDVVEKLVQFFTFHFSFCNL